MPIYEFKCRKCGNTFEYLCLIGSDKENAKCPSCGHGETEILLSTFSSSGSIYKTREGAGIRSLSSCSGSGGFS